MLAVFCLHSYLPERCSINLTGIKSVLLITSKVFMAGLTFSLCKFLNLERTFEISEAMYELASFPVSSTDPPDTPKYTFRLTVHFSSTRPSFHAGAVQRIGALWPLSSGRLSDLSP